MPSIHVCFNTHVLLVIIGFFEKRTIWILEIWVFSIKLTIYKMIVQNWLDL